MDLYTDTQARLLTILNLPRDNVQEFDLRNVRVHVEPVINTAVGVQKVILRR